MSPTTEKEYEHIGESRGCDPGGIIVTIVLGIVGAVVSGFLGAFFGFGTVTGFDGRRMRIAIGGALILPFGYRLIAVRALA